MANKMFTFDYGKYTSDKQAKAEDAYAHALKNRAQELKWFDEIGYFSRSEYLNMIAHFKAKEAENMGDPSRLPKLEHPLIECSECAKLRSEPNVEECEFCNEDVCDDCWDEHRCDSE
jgi:hypothetical protein